MVVGLARTDPKPMEIVAIAVRDAATRPAYVNGPNLTLLLQRKRGMKGIPFDPGEFTVSQGPDVFQKRVVAFPKLG